MRLSPPDLPIIEFIFSFDCADQQWFQKNCAARQSIFPGLGADGTRKPFSFHCQDFFDR
jgi:hypothetical protein